MTDQTTTEVTRVLREHSHYAPDARTQEEMDGACWECADCGHTFDVMFDDDPTSAMAAHQAAMLAEAGLLRGVAASEPRHEQPKRRLRECVENWPEAETGEYNPSCCRFPKSCSATVYDEGRVTEEDLEPQIATQEPAGGAQGGSAAHDAPHDEEAP